MSFLARQRPPAASPRSLARSLVQLPRRVPGGAAVGGTWRRTGSRPPFPLPRSLYQLLLAAVAIGMLGTSPNLQATRADELAEVTFNRDIRPILSDHCFQCHGPDAGQRVSALRLDTEEGLHGLPGEASVLVPGDWESSELWQRITSEDPDYRMPPEEGGRPLTAAQQETIRRWLEEGAAWQPHWAFLTPEKAPIPEVPADPAFSSLSAEQPLDRFVFQELSRRKLTPSRQADRATLLRRVSLDLTGLPPSPAELAEFLADESPDAYDRVVDRLLASPAYGERMAIPWLDAARYSDTSGYQTDGPREMWRWRDWVIQSLNANMPFDQFTIEQLAGDLLPQPTLAQRIATGFHRNHRGNSEGGIIPEEYQVEYVVDRVATTGAVWLGLTLECARCHDHKYDPISQREFYQLYAFFNNIPEHGRAIKEGNSPPYILAPTDEQQDEWAKWDKRLEDLTAELPARERQLAKELSDWKLPSGDSSDSDWHYSDGLLARLPPPAREEDGETVSVAVEEESKEESLELDSPQDDSSKGDSLADQEPRLVTQRGVGTIRLDGGEAWEGGDIGKFGYLDAFSAGAWIRPTEVTGTILSRMVPEPEGEGYYLHLEEGRIQVNLVKRWLDDSIRIETREAWEPGEWMHLLFTYDGSRQASGVRVYVNGREVPVDVKLDALNQSFELDQPLRIGGGQSGFHGGIQDVRIYDRSLHPEEVAVVFGDRAIGESGAKSASERSELESTAVRYYFLERQASPDLRDWFREFVTVKRQRMAFLQSLPTVMVMEEMETPRETYVLARGEYDKPTDQVGPGVPECLPALETLEFRANGPRTEETRAELTRSERTRADEIRSDETVAPEVTEGSSEVAQPNRLTLAHWLTDRQHPLTARVVVNRQWELFFGVGLVKTSEDFGVQGEAPSHPELLDWLACEFMESGWDLKRLHRLIVTSRTYRQDSRVTAELSERDPENRWLARGPRFRLSAELLRDQALALGGLLTQSIGGPSVKPYQPEGLWEEIASVTHYDQSQGADLYRRGLYSYWKRTVAPPSMMTLDATARETCLVQRTRTNTPLQALTLMNDVTFVEAARHLASRVMMEGGDSADERMQYAFQLVTARQADPHELDVLLRGLARHIAHFREDPESARALLTVGDSPPPAEADKDLPEWAAYSVLMNLLLNLDEVLTKG
jgi:hypothetical protein